MAMQHRQLDHWYVTYGPWNLSYIDFVFQAHHNWKAQTPSFQGWTKKYISQRIGFLVVKHDYSSLDSLEIIMNYKACQVSFIFPSNEQDHGLPNLIQ